MLIASAEMIAQDLTEYGEEGAASWLLTCSDEELVRVCSVASWLLYNGPRRASGSSMMLARACALAAVYVHEGSPRELVRSRRKKAARQDPVPQLGRRPDYQLQTQMPNDYGVGDDARVFWTR